MPGCMDEIACNYNEQATTDDGSCDYPEQYFDCNGNCLNDENNDGVCDELEMKIISIFEPDSIYYTAGLDFSIDIENSNIANGDFLRIFIDNFPVNTFEYQSLNGETNF